MLDHPFQSESSDVPSGSVLNEIFISHEASLRTLIAESIDRRNLANFFISRLPLFFLRGNFSRFQSKVDPIHTKLRNLGIHGRALPSKPDLSALAGGRP